MRLAISAAAFVSACAAPPPAETGTAVDAALFDSVTIAPTREALTFARIRTGDDHRVLAVQRYEAGQVDAVDLSAALQRDANDPVALFREYGYERLQHAIDGAAPAARVTVAAADLVQPLDLRDAHIAAGTNYPEHASDAGVENGPFLFPKLVAPTPPRAPVDAGDALLDYEVEVAWVTLEPLAKGATPPHMGVMLCNDYTDRATLLRHVDPWKPESGDGFATGKSFDGYLPVGDLFVIPRDFRSFATGLELRLYVNEAVRQQSPASLMVWDFDEILAQTWARQQTTWEHRGTRVALPGMAEGVIPERTLIMAGTPSGTVFEGVTMAQKLGGVLDWILGGWGRGVPSHAIERYIGEARSAGIYLRRGDRVVIHVERAGTIRNEVR
ncbi:MAG TPA: fumarylacetoacetate hydrolase family protein [Candidatus Limnocylindrales bacterium]|nr:fumarylacetoacetate hydrolase family protein [Candidatus Limnocylindrales bacterium]